MSHLADDAIQAKEPGTLVHACHEVEGAPDQRVFYELYADRAALEEHERQPHTRRFLAELTKFVATTEVERLPLYAGKTPADPDQ